MKPLLPRPVLMLVTEPSDRMMEIVLEAVEGGVNVVQVRNRGSSVEELRLREILASRERLRGRAVLLLNTYPLMAAESILPEGFHVPEADDFATFKHRVGPRWLVGRSVHSVESARRAEAEGADYVVAGTIFASPSHPEVAPRGLDFLRHVCAAVAIPVIAIGGVTPENAPDCLRAGAAGLAVLSPIMRAADPRATAVAYWRALTTDGHK